jgi:hypothetical protein
MTVARRHHYVSAGLLAGFTEGGTRDEMLWVHDLQARRQPWRARPENAAHERDYNRLETGEDDPLIVEDAHAELEDRALPIVRAIERTQAPPSGDDLKALLGFVAHLATRVPHHRKWLADSMNRIGKLELEMAAGTRERFAERVAAMGAAGVNVERLTFEHVREVIDSERFRLEPQQTWLVAHGVIDGERVYHTLLQRKWGVQIVARGVARFVGSDNPVRLMPLDQRLLETGWGWGTPHTAVVLPLSKRVALVGTDEQLAWGTVRIVTSPVEVAETNAFTLATATRFIYSASEDVIWMRSNGRMGHTSDLHELPPKS